MMNNEEMFFDVPATRGTQGGVEQYMLSVPMIVLRRLLAIDDQGDVMARSQREANKTRTRKIANYLKGATYSTQPYILPSITGNIEEQVDFVPSELSPAVGILKIPMHADLKLFDGQHRAIGIMDFVRDCPDTADTISLLLTVGLSLEMRQQFFSDINNNASKPAAAISMAYNNSDPVNQLAMYLAQNVPGLIGAVDYEHNAVPAKSSLLISFKALNDATKKMLSLRADSDPTNQQKAIAQKIWSAWSAAMRWNDIAQDDLAAEYRREALGLHGVMINAIGMATARMLQTRTPEEIVALLACAESGDKGFHYRETFLHENWKDLCVDPNTGTIRTDRRSLEATATALQNLIDPFAECAWIRPYTKGCASDAMLIKFNGYIDSLKQDSGVHHISIVEKLEQLRDMEDSDRSQTTATMRAFRKFMATEI